MTLTRHTGGLAVDASLAPSAIAINRASNNMYIADATHHVIRCVLWHSKTIITVAGVRFTASYSGDGELRSPPPVPRFMGCGLGTSHVLQAFTL